MNLGQMKSRVRAQFGDEAGVVLSDTILTGWLNEAQNDIARKTEILQQYVTLSPVADDGSYNLPTNLHNIRRVTFEGQKLRQTTLEEADHNTQGNEEATGDPYLFYVWGNQLWLFPVPNKSADNTIGLFYVKLPRQMAGDADECELPVTLHKEVVKYALAQAKDLDEEHAEASNLMVQYEIEVLQGAHDSYNKTSDSYPSVRTLPGDDW